MFYFWKLKLIPFHAVIIATAFDEAYAMFVKMYKLNRQSKVVKIYK